MASYKINQEQRDRFDNWILGALRSEMSPINAIVDRVKTTMVATGERWAITYSRDATFDQQIGNALRRWREKKRAERGSNPRVSEWRLVPMPTRSQMIDELVAQVADWDLETLLQHARDTTRIDLARLTDDEVAAQWRDVAP